MKHAHTSKTEALVELNVDELNAVAGGNTNVQAVSGVFSSSSSNTHVERESRENSTAPADELPLKIIIIDY